jgi:hypothetical protein
MEIRISGFRLQVAKQELTCLPQFFYKLLADDSVSASKTTNLEMFQAPSLFDL